MKTNYNVKKYNINENKQQQQQQQQQDLRSAQRKLEHLFMKGGDEENGFSITRKRYRTFDERFF